MIQVIRFLIMDPLAYRACILINIQGWRIRSRDLNPISKLICFQILRHPLLRAYDH